MRPTPYICSLTPPHPWHARAIGRVVILLIDALRADFVLDNEQLGKVGVNYNNPHESSSSIPSGGEETAFAERPKIGFLRTMLQRGQAVCLVAEATPPTVTLPRIKVRYLKGCVTMKL